MRGNMLVVPTLQAAHLALDLEALRMKIVEAREETGGIVDIHDHGPGHEIDIVVADIIGITIEIGMTEKEIGTETVTEIGTGIEIGTEIGTGTRTERGKG